MNCFLHKHSIKCICTHMLKSLENVFVCFFRSYKLVHKTMFDVISVLCPCQTLPNILLNHLIAETFCVYFLLFMCCISAYSYSCSYFNNLMWSLLYLIHFVIVLPHSMEVCVIDLIPVLILNLFSTVQSKVFAYWSNCHAVFVLLIKWLLVITNE